MAAFFGLTRSLAEGTIVPRLATTEVRQKRALPVRDLTLDITPPECVDFGINLNTAILYIYFDEAVQSTSLILTDTTLLASSIGESVTLTGATSVELINKTVLAVSLIDEDFNAVKRAHFLSSLQLDNLLLNVGAVQDYQGNEYQGNTEDDPRLVRFLVSDTTAPLMTALDIDMRTSVLTVTFSEVVLSSSIVAENIYLSTTSIATDGNITVLQPVVNEVSPGVVSIDLGLYREDAETMKNSVFGTTTGSSYLTIQGTEDLFGNKNPSQTIQATSITDDISSPELIGMDFSTTSGNDVVLYFSVPVNIASFDCTDFTFQSHKGSSPDESFTPTTDDCSITTTDVSGAAYSIAFTLANDLMTATPLMSHNISYRWVNIPTVGTTLGRNSIQLASLSADKSIRAG
jgi:hypothetical protein